MPRPRRIQTPRLLRHVMSRGNGRMAIFLDDGDYRQFVHLLGETCERFAMECWSYCAMPNHYHAALWPNRPNLSDGIQHLNGEFAKWWNRKHGRVGHTLQGRFKAQIVSHDQYLLTLLRYIALNPVRAGLVDRPGAWRWGSYPALAGIDEAPPFLAVERVLSVFGEGDQMLLRERFVRYVAEMQPNSAAIEDRIRSSERVLGDTAFKALVCGEAPAESDPGLTRV